MLIDSDAYSKSPQKCSDISDVEAASAKRSLQMEATQSNCLHSWQARVFSSKAVTSRLHKVTGMEQDTVTHNRDDEMTKPLDAIGPFQICEGQGTSDMFWHLQDLIAAKQDLQSPELDLKTCSHE